MSGSGKRLVLRTYERRSPEIPTGVYLTRHHDARGNPFVVFCTNEGCRHWLEGESALPHWSEDCPEHLGFLRCPECGAPVVRPPRNPDAR